MNKITKIIAETTDQNSSDQKMIQKNDDRSGRQNWHDKKITDKIEATKINNKQITHRMTDRVEITNK